MSQISAHDSHIHLTSLSPDAEHPIRNVLRAMDESGVERAAVVTPGTMGWDNEVTFGAVEARPDRFVAVIRVDLEAPDPVEKLGAGLDRGARALRLTLFDRDDDLLDHPVLPAIAQTLQSYSAAVELHARPDQLGSAERLARQHPELSIVIDHLGRPDVAESPGDSGYAAFRALGKYPNVVAKTPNSSFFSRMPNPYSDLRPYFEYALDAWGADRLMWGSDWPLCESRDTYLGAFQPLLSVLHGRSESERAAVLRTTFERVLMAPRPSVTGR